MKNIIRFFTSRIVLSAILIIFQIFVIFALFSRFMNNTLVSQTFTLLSFLFGIWIVFHKQEPEYVIGWLLLIMVFPLYGAILYLILGKKTISPSNRKRLNKFVKAFTRTSNINENKTINLKKLEELDSDLSRQSKYISRSAYSTLWKNTEANYYPLGDEFLQDFLIELDKAEKFIFIEFFIIGFGEMWTSILEILHKKKDQGVEIRIMYDDFGSFGVIPSNYDVQLRKAGFKAQAFNPIKPSVNIRYNYRDHRKICVIDGNVGFTGGVNLADEYINRDIRFGHWKDNAVKLKGMGVWDLTVLFLSQWNVTVGDNDDDFSKYAPTLMGKSDGYVQPFGDNPLDEVAMAETAYLQIINMAKDYVWITTPYLIITRNMINALSVAAQSGVDVRIVVPKIPDKKYVYEVSQSYYLELIKAGVKIFEYTPGFIHSKMFISDDKVSIIGTVNMDYRSFYLHFECGVAFFLSSIIKDVKKDFNNIFEISEPIDYDKASKVLLIKRLYRLVVRLFSPIL